MPFKVLNLAEAAEFLHVDPSAMDELMKKQDLPFEYQGGRAVFRRQELHDWASTRILGLDAKKLSDYHTQATRWRPPPDRSEAFLSQFLEAEGIDVHLAAGTRPSLLRKLVKLAAETTLSTDDALLLQLLEEREELYPTSLNDGVAIPHTRVHSEYLFVDSFLVIAYVPGGIPFGAQDGKMSDLFFMPCTPDQRTHIYMLARLARLLQATNLAESLRDCSSADDVISTFHLIEAEFVEQHIRSS